MKLHRQTLSIAVLPILLLSGCRESGGSKKNGSDNDALAFDGVTLSLTDGDGTLTADLSSLQDDADSDPLNELQALSFDELTGDLSIAGGNTVTLPDSDVQTLAFDPGTRTLFIENGNMVSIPDIDTDTDTDAQTLSLADGMLSISGGNTVTLPGLQRTVVVSPGANPSEAGAALMAALASLPQTSDLFRIQVVLEPGIYDLGAGTIDVPQFVALRGAGAGRTKITGQGAPQLISAATGSELRDLTVEVIGINPGLEIVGVRPTGPNVDITGVRIVADGSASVMAGVLTFFHSLGVVSDTVITIDSISGVAIQASGAALIRDTTINTVCDPASAGVGVLLGNGGGRIEGTVIASSCDRGLHLFEGQYVVVESDISGLGSALLVSGAASLKARGVVAKASTAVFLSSPSAQARLLGSRVEGSIFNQGSLVCAFSVNATYAPLTAGCTP